MASYTIRDLEKISGIKAHTIRIWEKRYHIVNPSRTQTNIRFYDDDDLKRLLNISILNRHGHKISKLAHLDNQELTEKVIDISKDSYDTDSQIENLVLSMIEMDESKFEKILSRIILQIGFEETVTKVLYPFFEKVGILWQTGSINPIQEHFISNLVRQKILVAIDGLVVSNHPQPKSFSLFLPEGEMHEIGLLFYSYLLRKKGHKVIYFGQSVPYVDLEVAEQIHPCDFFLTSFVANISPEEIEAYLKKLTKDFPGKKIILTGHHASAIDSQKFPHLIRIQSGPELREFVEKL